LCLLRFSFFPGVTAHFARGARLTSIVLDLAYIDAPSHDSDTLRTMLLKLFGEYVYLVHRNLSLYAVRTRQFTALPLATPVEPYCRWRLEGKVHSFTADGASVNVKLETMPGFDGIPRIHCFAHLTNLAVKDALDNESLRLFTARAMEIVGCVIAETLKLSCLLAPC
jgi:hypothetical protein